MGFKSARTVVAVLTVCLVAAVPAQGHAQPQHKRLDPIYLVAAKHHWDQQQVRYWLDVLWDESRSTLGHYDLWAVNGDCVGAGQLNGGWGAYAQYGGSSGTALGQLEGMAGYIASRYGTPAGAEAHELADGWY